MVFSHNSQAARFWTGVHILKHLLNGTGTYVLPDESVPSSKPSWSSSVGYGLDGFSLLGYGTRSQGKETL